METKFKIGEKVWFITPLSHKVFYGTIMSTAPNGCHTVQSGQYAKMLFDNELFTSKEEAEKGNYGN